MAVDEIQLATDITEIKGTVRRMETDLLEFKQRHGERLLGLETFQRLHEALHARQEGVQAGRGEVTATISARDKWLFGIVVTLINVGAGILVKLL